MADQVVSSPTGTRFVESVPCGLCGGDDFETVHQGCRDEILGTSGRWGVMRCSACGLAQTRPRPTREAIAAHYPRHYLPFGQEEARRSRLWALGHRLLSAPYRLRYGTPDPELGPPGGPLLDIGCGAGIQLGRLRAAGWDVWGIEPDPASARQAAHRAGIPSERVVVCQAEEADFPPGSFEAVVMGHVIEHLHEPAAVLENVARWLRPAGRLAIRCPNFGSREARLFGRHWAGLDVPRHLHHFTPASLARLVGAAGFDVIRVRPELEYGMVPLSLHLAARARRPGLVGTLPPRSLFLASLAPVALSRGLGAGGCIELTARRVDAARQPRR